MENCPQVEKQYIFMKAEPLFEGMLYTKHYKTFWAAPSWSWVAKTKRDPSILRYRTRLPTFRWVAQPSSKDLNFGKRQALASTLRTRVWVTHRATVSMFLWILKIFATLPRIIAMEANMTPNCLPSWGSGLFQLVKSGQNRMKSLKSQETIFAVCFAVWLAGVWSNPEVCGWCVDFQSQRDFGCRFLGQCDLPELYGSALGQIWPSGQDPSTGDVAQLLPDGWRVRSTRVLWWSDFPEPGLRVVFKPL